MLFSSNETAYGVAVTILDGPGVFGRNFVSGKLARRADSNINSGDLSKNTICSKRNCGACRWSYRSRVHLHFRNQQTRRLRQLFWVFPCSYPKVPRLWWDGLLQVGTASQGPHRSVFTGFSRRSALDSCRIRRWPVGMVPVSLVCSCICRQFHRWRFIGYGITVVQTPFLARTRLFPFEPLLGGPFGRGRKFSFRLRMDVWQFLMWGLPDGACDVSRQTQQYVTLFISAVKVRSVDA